MRAANILHLGIKELRSLLRDPIMVVLVIYAFTFSIYTAATAQPETLHKAAIAIVDEDRSPLSMRIADSFFPPHFLRPVFITQSEMDTRMDNGLDTFALNIPPDFQRDVLAGRNPSLQLNVDATRMSQAFTGSGYIQSMVLNEVNAFVQGYQANAQILRECHEFAIVGRAAAFSSQAEHSLRVHFVFLFFHQTECLVHDPLGLIQ